MSQSIRLEKFCGLIVVVFLWAVPAHATINVRAWANCNVAGTNTCNTGPVGASSGPNVAEFCIVSWWADSGQTVLSVTHNRLGAMTAIPSSKGNNGNVTVQGFYLVEGDTAFEPDTTTVTFSANVTDGILGGVTYDSINQSTPFDSAHTHLASGASGTNPSNTVTTQANNNMLAGTYINAYGAFWVGAGQTERWNRAPNSPYNSGASDKVIVSGTTATMTWTRNGDGPWEELGLDICAASITCGGPMLPQPANQTSATIATTTGLITGTMSST